jgi:hypothetical protein
MANRDLLKEAIADAKAVKETAIANAKAALEEAFTPLMQEKFAKKIAQLDEEETELEEAYEMEEGEKEEMQETYEVEEAEAKSTDSMEEGELDLEELLRELDEMEKNINMTEFPDEAGEHGNIGGQNVNEAEEIEEIEEAEEGEESEEEEEEIDLENMSEDDLKSFIESVIADMVAAGELEGNIEGGEEGEEEESEEEEVEIDEAKEMEEEGMKVDEMKKEMEEMKFELEEAYNTIKTIKEELSEVNLFNAKLLYTNKIFKSKNLTESQKVKVLAAFDKAASVKEAKLVFETLTEGFKETKKTVNESLLVGSASKPAGVAAKKPIMEVNDQFARWQKLAGIK